MHNMVIKIMMYVSLIYAVMVLKANLPSAYVHSTEQASVQNKQTVQLI